MAALATSVATGLAAAVPAATAAEPQSGDPGSGDAGRGLEADDLEPAEATAVDAADSPAKLGTLSLGEGQTEQTFLVRLEEPAVPSYSGGIEGLAATAPDPGEQLDPDSPNVRDYRAHLEQAQAELIDNIEDLVNRRVDVPFTYQHAVNGVAAELTPDEATEVAGLPGVASVAADEERELHTDAGPQWLGADALWNATGELGLPEDYKGEGVIIGTIDTGISPGNRSFAETGDDGYTHENPLGDGEFLGACDPDNTEQFDPDFPCNNKLIGAYVFGGANDSALDYDGHGSHTASTSGGNVVDDVTVESDTITTDPVSISGVAPHANVISYLGCCTVSGLTASIDQAIADGVDVINYSIGSSDPGNPWAGFDTLGFLNARAAGIFVATSNGNDGPGAATTGSPSSAPWVTSVGASSHNRAADNAVIDLTSSAGDLDDIHGRSVTGSLPASPIVDGADFGSATCGEGSVSNPVNPFEPGTFDGEIVVCDRGVVGRVQKSVHLAEAGAGGIIHVNDEVNGASLLGDAFAVPGVHISFSDGQVLKDWLDNGADDHTGAIQGTEFVVDDAFGDVMASFSSRGPNRVIDVIVPDVTAPGMDILAALGADSYTVDEHGIISGTSMSSPHVAGTGALLSQARPDWTPAQMQSALMTTARDVRNHDGEPATPYAQGAGHVNVDAAVRAGLLFDETAADYLAADPAEGGDPTALNLPSFADTSCLNTCSWERTATAPSSAPDGVTWTASVETDDGLELDVDLAPGTVSPGDSMDITVTADVAGAPVGETLFGEVVLTPSDPDVPAVGMPVAVEPVTGVLPGSADVDTRRNAGSHLVTGIESIEVTDFTGSIDGFVPATVEESTLVQDATNGDPYDDLSQVDVYEIDVPDGATRLVAEMVEWEMPDADMYVGTGDTPSADTEVCSSTSPSSGEACDIADPQAGDWWVLIQNWTGSTPEADDAYSVATAVVPGEDLGNGGVQGPDGPVPPGEPYDVRVHWDIPEMAAGDIWYGTAVLGSSPDSPGDIGSFPVTLRRAGDDVTKTASVSEAQLGDTVSYEITVEPNVTPEDLTYTITDTVPDGLTIDPDSVTGDGVVDGQTITWEVEQPTPVGEAGDYVASTPATSEQCADWSGFTDLGALGIGLAGLDGDTTAATAFGDIGPFEHYGDDFPDLVVAEDGLVTVTGGYGGSPWVPQDIPDPNQPNGVIAPLWSDLELSLADERGMRLASADFGDYAAAVIQWDDPFEFTPDTSVGPSVGTFQTWIYTTVEDFRPEITFDYGELGELPDAATIGIENILGDQATAVLGAGDPAALLEQGGSICLDYEGPTFEPITVGYDVTVDDDAFSDTYTNDVVHVTDDPFAEEATESVDVEVTGIEPCEDVISGRHFGPLQVSDGVTCLEGATVFGPVNVSDGAALRSSDGSRIVGPVYSSGAEEVTVCDTRVVGPVTLTGTGPRDLGLPAVTFGDPASDCAGNTVVGPVTVSGTEGPSVVADNRIGGPLSCSGNDPAPVDNGFPNNVLGPKGGQCSDL
ncbi:MAG: S8 family serine peptidase [Actinomycetota bacterium]